MDTGLKGKRAIVCAASKGLGRACAMALAREGVAVTITARTRETLEATAAEIRRATGADGDRGRRRHHHRGGPRRRARRLSRSPTSW